MRIAVVVPVYNERDTLVRLAEGILTHVRPHPCQLIFVDDGSTDGSADVLEELTGAHPEVEVVRFPRNRGKSAALAAGFARARGDAVFTLDADLQDDPEEIPRFLEALESGFDLVCGWKENRLDPWHKTLPSRVYNWAVSRVFGLRLHDINCGFKLYRMAVIRDTRVYGELHRLIPVLAAARGYRVGEVPVRHHRRQYGVSKYGWERFGRGALDVVTVWFLTRHGDCPGHFFGGAGLAQGGLAVLAWLAAALSLGAGWGTGLTVGLGVAGMVLACTGATWLGLGLLGELLLFHQRERDGVPSPGPDDPAA